MYSVCFSWDFSPLSPKSGVGILQPKKVADIVINFPFNGEEGDFKDLEGSEVHKSDEIFGHRNWYDLMDNVEE